MSITINAKGTSVSSFEVGRNGTSITQAGSISPPALSDLVLSLGDSKSLLINTAGIGPSRISTTGSKDLYIDPTSSGGRYLVLNAVRFPATDGAANQVLATNGAGVLTWSTPAPATTGQLTPEIVTTTSATAVNGVIYLITNAAVTTISLPSSPAVGDTVQVKVANGLVTNVINPGANTIEGTAGTMTLDAMYAAPTLRFINSSWRLV